MSVSPDDRFASLVGQSQTRGWTPEDEQINVRDLIPGNRPVPTKIVVLIILAIAVVGVVGYMGYSAWKTSPVEPTVPLDMTTTAAATEIAVHVTGEVKEPGLITLPVDSRVADALTAAGGPTTKASLEAVNLARKLSDGEQLYIPSHDSADAAGQQSPGITNPQAGVPDAPNNGATNPATALVNINVADATTLETLPGVGPATSAAIIEYRQTHGPFAKVEDLELVRGIGPATFEKLKPLITV